MLVDIQVFNIVSCRIYPFPIAFLKLFLKLRWSYKHRFFFLDSYIRHYSETMPNYCNFAFHLEIKSVIFQLFSLIWYLESFKTLPEFLISVKVPLEC